MKRTLMTLAFVAASASTTWAQAGPSPDLANAPTAVTGAAATAKKRIEMDGYKDVQGLAKGPEGLWQGTAMRGNTSVQVTVDHSGNVVAK